MNSNEKRINSCKLVGGNEKKKGHQREDDFELKWGSKTNTSYKAEADKVITDESFLDLLRNKLGDIVNGNTSIKGGRSIQFTLGNIPEISKSSNKLESIKQISIWQKYLGKYSSSKPASIMAYKGLKYWTFFRMIDIIEFIVEECIWRELPSSRLKGDFKDETSKNKKRTILTFEHRNGKHNSDFLGASGGQGIFFINILKQNIKFHEELI